MTTTRSCHVDANVVRQSFIARIRVYSDQTDVENASICTFQEVFASIRVAGRLLVFTRRLSAVCQQLHENNYGSNFDKNVNKTTTLPLNFGSHPLRDSEFHEGFFNTAREDMFPTL